jgi:simple sugar transport system ATP-binding protein
MLDIMVNDMGGRQFVRWRSIHSRAREVLDLLNVNIDTKKPVNQFSLAQKQMILIARAICKECKFLILDEPTAPLSHTESRELFRVVRDILKQGIGVIFISHRLSEILDICDKVTILRDGEFVGMDSMENTSINRIVEMMLGRRFDENYPKYRVPIGRKIFEVQNLGDYDKVRNIDLYVRSGEIIGVAGLVGAGKSELCKALFGATSVHYDLALIQGKQYNIHDPFRAVNRGVALVPEERRKEGILVEESVVTNLTAASLAQFCTRTGFIRFGKERASARGIIKSLGVKTQGESQRVRFLSGGNQQKVAVGKWLITEADIYILDEPTKGIDVGAKKDIFELIGRLAREGKAVIYVSCELAEIMGITDRVYVMYNGRIVKELETDMTSEEKLLFYSSGGK